MTILKLAPPVTEDPDVKLARDCVAMTGLRGPLPIATTMCLAQAVLRLSGKRELEAEAVIKAHMGMVTADWRHPPMDDGSGRRFPFLVTLWAPPDFLRGACGGGETLAEATNLAKTILDKP